MENTKKENTVPGKFLKVNIKEYCKLHKLKFEEYTSSGFIASSKIEIRAGMQYDPIIGNGKIISMRIRKIGSRRIRTKFLCYSDGDIVHGKVLNEL